MRYLLPIFLALGLTGLAVLLVAHLTHVTSLAGIFAIGVVLGATVMPLLRDLFDWLFGE